MYTLIGSNGFLLYTICTVYISSAALLIFNLTQMNKKRKLLSSISHFIIARYRYPNTSTISTVLVVSEIVLTSLFQHGLVSPLNFFVGSFFDSGANYFGLIFFMPILLPVFCWIIGVNPFKQIDLITPAYPLALFFMKLGCFFAGCCGGIPCRFGIYDPRSQQTEIPIQLIEAIIALLLFFYMLNCRKKAKEGTLLPIYIILYCCIRFFSEFLRSDPNVIWLLKTYHILCLIGILWGILLLFILHKYKDTICSIFEKNLPCLIFPKQSK